MAEVELHPGIPFCSAETLNRIARQQGLCLAIAQASIFDEICQLISLPTELEEALVHTYLDQNDLSSSEDRDLHLQARGWDDQDLAYFRHQAGTTEPISTAVVRRRRGAAFSGPQDRPR